MNPLDLPRSRTGQAIVVLGCFVAPALAACHASARAPEVTGTTGATSLATTKPVPIPDPDIGQAILRHFHEEKLLRGEPVRVAVTEGVAALTGSVSNLRAKGRAVAVAESIRGVRSVVDQVTVEPIARTDDQLQADVKKALEHDAATRSFAIAVASKDAAVTLSGIADSWQQKKLFADAAEAVPGVKSIDNAVTIRYAVERPQSEIAADVKSRIANDLWLDGDTIGVAVTGHTVRLTGIVASATQKSRARSDGWVAGVGEVDDGAMTVDGSARDDQKRETDSPIKSDSQIGQAIHTAFLIDPRLKISMPQVAVQNGVVSLSGTVDSPAARRSAENDAKDTVGVWTVRDDALVQPAGQLTDADIEHGVERALKEDLLLSDGSKAIKVSSKKGKVALSGKVASGFQRFGAIADAEDVPGIVEIDDDLVVNLPPAEIKSTIEDNLFWDPMVQRDRVHVDVASDGVATLTGTLDAWSEIKAAADDALAGGATRVVDLLKLNKHPELVAP